ncbi:notch (dsl) domain-containing protein [Cryptosporidium felis]|nr:notch (dsl) domain-containing protein [Cryptosporidium felis]
MKTTKLLIYYLIILEVGTSLSLDSFSPNKKTNVIPVTKGSTNIIPTRLDNGVYTSRNRRSDFDGLRQEFPNCPMSCKESWVNDGWCDKECFSDDCGNDGKDCLGWCAPECRPSWLGDGQCDIDCFNSKCNWDNGDCRDENFEMRKKLVLKLEKISVKFEFDYSNCNCNKELLGNNICDIECNTIECNMDKGDCLHRCNSRCINTWLGDGQCDPSCDTKECFFDKGDCKTCSKTCRTWMIGNGICDKNCNNKECKFDGGDCANVCSVSEVDYVNQPLIYRFCLNSWVGDGHCDDDCNNEECNFDNGDCKSGNNSTELNFTYEASLNPPRKVTIQTKTQNSSIITTNNSTEFQCKDQHYSILNINVNSSIATTTTTTTTTTNATSTTQHEIVIVNNVAKRSPTFVTTKAPVTVFSNVIVPTTTLNVTRSYSNNNTVNTNYYSRYSGNLFKHPGNSHQLNNYVNQIGNAQYSHQYYYTYRPEQLQNENTLSNVHPIQSSNQYIINYGRQYQGTGVKYNQNDIKHSYSGNNESSNKNNQNKFRISNYR